MSAVEVFSALGSETRLKAFRILVEAGPAGLPAGAISRTLQVPPSTLTVHLRRLVQSGLVRSWRSERNIFYAIQVEQVREAVSYLTLECCRGQPELCGFEGRDRTSTRKMRDSA